jgi:hypothetical protein
MRCLASDQRLHVAFDLSKYPAPEGGHDIDTAIHRLTELIKNGPEKPSKVAAPKPAAAKKVAPKPEEKVTAAPAKLAGKPEKKEVAAPKPVEKKPVAAKKPLKKSR